MKQTLKNMRIRKWMGVLFAAVLMTALGAQTALASTDYVKSISITLDVAPVPGEDLPALHYGYTGDTGYEVKIPSTKDMRSFQQNGDPRWTRQDLEVPTPLESLWKHSTTTGSAPATLLPR